MTSSRDALQWSAPRPAVATPDDGPPRLDGSHGLDFDFPVVRFASACGPAGP